MPEFQNPFFTSASADVEAEYESGVRALQRGDTNAASRHFVSAAQGGQVSALFNLSLLWGGGSVTPYDFDLAADCWYKAAEAGHPRAKAALWHLEAADRGGYGADNLAKFAEEANPSGSLIPSIMISAARFYDVICRKYGATADVIAYELDAAATSDFDFVHSFIERTGIDKEFYEGGLDRLKTGSAADQITDGLSKLHVAMMRSGVSDKLAIMARCSIAGHIIAKSPYGDRSQPLLGVDTFFENSSSMRGEDSMFWNKKDKKESQTTKDLINIGAKPLLITKSGKIIFTSELLKNRDNKWLGGSIIEVMISSPADSPYFIYYENEEYYRRMAVGIQGIGDHNDNEGYRSKVSIELLKFLIIHMMENYKKDIRHPQMQFSHNRIHTNVMAFIETLGEWYPIQHSSSESDSATERKVAMINSRKSNVTEFIAMHQLSPQ